MREIQCSSDIPIMRTVPGHHDSAPYLITKEMFGGLPFELAGAEILNLVDKPVADMHSHDIPEIYLLVSPTYRGACIEIEFDHGVLIAESPCAIYIPSEVKHRFVTKTAEPGSYCFGIFITG